MGSSRQAGLEEAILVAPAIDFALVVPGSEIGGHREFRLAVQDLRRMRGQPATRAAHAGERSGEA